MCVCACAYVCACVSQCTLFCVVTQPFVFRCPLRSLDSPHAVSVTAVDDSGNERSCDFDIFIPVDEHVLARTEVVETFAFPMERHYAEANALLFYSHRIVPAPDSPIQTLHVRFGCEKQTTPIPSTRKNTRIHPHLCFSPPPSTPPSIRRMCPTSRDCRCRLSRAVRARRLWCVCCMRPSRCTSSSTCSTTQTASTRQASTGSKVCSQTTRGGGEREMVVVVCVCVGGCREKEHE